MSRKGKPQPLPGPRIGNGQTPAELAQHNTANGQTRLLVEESFHQGPIPSAAELAKINEIIPGGANRILSMAEKDAEHIRSMQGLAVAAETAELRRARTASMLVPLAGMTLSLPFLILGHPTQGAAVAGAALLPQLVTAILRARSGSKTT